MRDLRPQDLSLAGCRQDLYHHLRGGDTLIGEVYLWGRVIEHEHGYRAQFAYPRKLAWVRMGRPWHPGSLEDQSLQQIARDLGDYRVPLTTAVAELTLRDTGAFWSRPHGAG